MWESFISFGLALIDKWLVIVAGIVLPVLIGVPSLFFEKWEGWIKDHKPRIRKYKITFFVIMLGVATFLIYHDERNAYEEIKQKYSQIGIVELKAELEQLKDKIHKWPTEGSIDGEIGEIENKILVYRTGMDYLDVNPSDIMTDSKLAWPIFICGPFVITNNKPKSVTIDIYIEANNWGTLLDSFVLFKNQPIYDRGPVEGEITRFKSTSNGIISNRLYVYEYIKKKFPSDKETQLLISPLTIPAGQTKQGIVVFTFIPKIRSELTDLIKNKDDTKIIFVDAHTGDYLVEPMPAFSGGVLINQYGATEIIMF